MDIKAKFDHFNFNVTDLERSISFYNKALGFVESHRINSNDGSFIIVYLKDNQSDFLLELGGATTRKPMTLGNVNFTCA